MDGFPLLDPENLVDRANFIETIARLLNDSQVVFLEGEEGYGLTTLAAQFCQQFPSHSFGLFVKPSSRATYSPDFIRQTLAEQVSWFLDQEEFGQDSVDPKTFGSLLFRLRRRAIKKAPVYFVIDGMQKILHQESSLHEIFSTILPFWIENAKFVICGKRDDFKKYLADILSKYIQPNTFSLLETQRFMLPMIVDNHDVRTIQQLCKGIPGHLASVRRLLLGGSTLEQIFESSPEQFPSFIKLEFSQVEQLSVNAKKMLSLIAFSGRQLTTAELLKITNFNQSEISDLTTLCKFLVTSDVDGQIDFASDAHRKFACTILETDKTFALTEHIRYLSVKPSSPDALSFLPVYFQQLDQASELVRILTPDHFSHLLKMTSSLSSITARARLGMISASTLVQIPDVLRFSVMQSTFLGLTKAEGSSSQIRALVSLGRHQTALSIAFNCSTDEERLKFLAAYAKASKQLIDTINPEILAAIQHSAKSIDFSQIGEAAIDLATDIVHVDPDLAMSIVDEVSSGNTGVDKDIAFARLSLETSKKDSQSESSSKNTSRSRISDEKLQIFISSVTALISDYSDVEIISASATLESNRQLSFLGYWIGKHKNTPGALKVAEHALDIMIRDAAHKPKMREFHAIARALPHAEDIAKIKELVGRFDSQKGLIADSSISTDTVSLQMTLAHAEMLYDQEAAATRIIDCYFELSTSNNSDTKLECFPLMLWYLHSIDKEGKLEVTHGFIVLILSEFTPLMFAVLSNSADHFLIMKFALAQFSRFDITTAINIAESLNVEGRRDAAKVEICRTLQELDLTVDPIKNFVTTLALIRDDNSKWSSLEAFVENIAIRKERLEAAQIELLEQHARLIGNSILSARSFISLIKLRAIAGLEIPTGAAIELQGLIRQVDTSYNRSRLFFDACEVTASHSSETAAEFYELGVFEKNSSSMSTASLTQIFTYSLFLCSRSIGGSMISEFFDEEVLIRFIQLVDTVPADSIKIDIVSDLASRAMFNGRADIAKNLMATHVVPLIARSEPLGKFWRDILLTSALPVLYLTHQVIALQRFADLPRSKRENTIRAALDLIITKSPRTNPDLEGTKDDFEISFPDVLDALTLVELLEEDYNLYAAISRICRSVANKRNAKNFTAQQKHDIASRFKLMIATRLPDPINITHDGYVILCDACVLQLKGSVSSSDWDAVVARARAISNIADRGYVIYEISLVLPPKLSSMKVEQQKEALILFNSVPSAIDKINRLIVLSEGLAKDGIAIAKQSLRSAMEMTLHILDESTAREARRRIIDIADKIGGDFAEELGELIDTDIARRHARLDVKQRIGMFALKKKISNVKVSPDMTKAEIEHLPEASWRNLLGLIGGRLEIKAPPLMLKYIETSSRFDFHEAFPVLSWFVENISRKYVGSRDGGGVLKASSERLVEATEFIANVMLAMVPRDSEPSQVSTGSHSGDVLMGMNNRESALAFLEDWLSECSGEILLCDPFFGVKESDLQFLRIVLRACPNNEVTILTSRTLLAEQSAATVEQFLQKWREFCDQDPPATRIVGIGLLNNKKSVIHDRWLIAGNRGLRLGTSFNGIGTGKLSAISVLTEKEMVPTVNELNRFCKGERTIDGERIGYSSFTI